MPSVQENHHRESCYPKDLLREQTLRVLFRGLYAQMDPALAETTDISLAVSRRKLLRSIIVNKFITALYVTKLKREKHGRSWTLRPRRIL